MSCWKKKDRKVVEKLGDPNFINMSLRDFQSQNEYVVELEEALYEILVAYADSKPKDLVRGNLTKDKVNEIYRRFNHLLVNGPSKIAPADNITKVPEYY